MAGPLIPLLMMAGTAATSYFGGKEASRVAEENRNISLLNYYEQQRANQQAEAEARRQQREGKLGTTDGAGNRTVFIPGQGWTTILSDQQQQLQDLTEVEQLRQLTEEAHREERASARSHDRRNREDVLASAAEDELRLLRKQDAGGLRQLLIARGAQTRNDAADRAGEISSRAAIRGGGHNAAAIEQGARAEADAEGRRSAGIEAELLSRQMSNDEYNQKRSNAQGMLDYFRKMSTSNDGNIGLVNPQGPATRGTGSADQQMLQIMQTGAPQLDYQSPNNAYTDTAQNLINMFGSYNGMRATDKEIDRVNGNTGVWSGTPGVY